MNDFHQNILFDGISSEVMEELSLSIEEKRFEEGEVLFREGQPANHLYLLLEGEVRLSKLGQFGEQESLEDIRPRGFFGAVALLDGEPRSAQATAMTPVRVGLLDRPSFDRFLAHSPEIARHFAVVLSGRLRSANSSYMAKLNRAQRLGLLGTMMSSIVHDIRNPVASLAQVGHSLSKREDERLRNLGRITENAVEQIMAMIQELLDFSRGKIHLDVQSFTVRDFLQALDRQILSKIERAGITVVRDIQYDGIVQADQNRLLRLFFNILKNSWEAMQTGGVLTLRIRRSGPSLLLEIEDTGCGMEPNLLSRVFEPFVTQGKARGTGLGMAIAKSVAEAHRGTIRLESELGVGTTCYLCLPVCPPEGPGEGPDSSTTCGGANPVAQPAVGLNLLGSV